MLDNTEILASRERYKDFVREAENDRLVRDALAGRSPKTRLWRRGLNWFDASLLTWKGALARTSAPTEPEPLQDCLEPGCA